jgi:hypothetical protein
VWRINQDDAGTLSGLKGKVTDPAGEAIFEARLALFRVLKDGASFVGSLQTDDKGRYCFGKLKEGQYRLEVGAFGFQKYVYSLIISHKGITKSRFDVSLGIGY